ncbi:MAG: response regulator [Bdellovibrionaceae bacterium]|nr:response regulator [Pseudobdellovibrionaceae bacterium]
MCPVTTKILICDDMAQIRANVRRVLRDLNYGNILEADNGEKAFALLEAHSTSGDPVGFVISDWNMPVLTGIEFLRKVRAEMKWTNLPFILLTAESERSQITEAIVLGVSNYVLKPFTPKSLVEKMAAAWLKHHKT